MRTSFTRDEFESMLLDLQDQLKEFPTDAILRESGIPEAAVVQVSLIAEAIERAIELAQG